MKKLILLFLLLITFNCYSQLNKIGRDKYYHSAAGITIATGMWAIQQNIDQDTNPIFPTLLAAFIGTGKETTDAMTGGYFSGKDLAWTVGSAAITNTILYFIWNKHKRYKHK